MQVINISTRGAALYCATALDPGTPVTVKFYLNMNPHKQWLTFIGKVARTHHQRGDNSYLVRVVFTDPPAQAVATIRQFFQKKLEERPSKRFGYVNVPPLFEWEL